MNPPDRIAEDGFGSPQISRGGDPARTSGVFKNKGHYSRSLLEMTGKVVHLGALFLLNHLCSSIRFPFLCITHVGVITVFFQEMCV